MSFSSFIRSSTLDGVERVMVEGVSPLDRFEALQEQITNLAGSSLGKLLCEPLISEGNGEASTTVSWYAAYEGEATALTALSLGERKAAEARLRARIEALQPVIAAAPDGQLIAAALYLRDLSDVFVIAGEPVLTNWGLLPEGAAASQTKRNAVFATGLGALGLALTAPPLAAKEFVDWRDRLPGKAGLDEITSYTGATTDASVTETASTVPVAAVVTDAHLPWYRRAWAPALLATLLAAFVLLILLIPGVLLAPAPTAAVLINDQARLLEESNIALEERLDRLRRAQDEGVCTAEGNFEVGLPPARPGDAGVISPIPETGTQTDEAPAPVEESLLPPRLDDLNVPAEADGSDDSTRLLDVVDSSTVLVIAAGGNQVGIGSGFFVAPGLVVTNDHVIAEGSPGQLYVTNESLGRVIAVEIVARTGTSPDSKVDFALLRGDFGDQRIFTISDQATRLSHVVAAGFPLVVASEDARFRRLLEEDDPTAAPSTSTTRGVVTSIQNQTDGTEVIAHDAEINQGNSGGPLLDLCGRVVGVNTYLLRNEETRAVARFALHSRELRKFLTDNSVPATYSSDPCRPASATRQQEPVVPVAVETEEPAPEPSNEPAVESEPVADTEPQQSEPEATAEEAPAAEDTEAIETAPEEAAAPDEEARVPAAEPASVASIEPPAERRVSSQEAGLPDGVLGDVGLAPE